MADITVICLALTGALPLVCAINAYVVHRMLKHLDETEVVGGTPKKIHLYHTQSQRKRIMN